MLSQRGRYALKAMQNLASVPSSGARGVTTIGAEENIPRKFLEAIMGDLRQAGLVEGLKGKLGGYRLARPAELISVSDIMRATDGPIALLPCVSRNFYQRCQDCVDEQSCALRRVIADVRNEMTALLDRATLADLCSDSAKVAGGG